MRTYYMVKEYLKLRQDSVRRHNVDNGLLRLSFVFTTKYLPFITFD